MRKKVTVMAAVATLFGGVWACQGMPLPPDTPPPPRCGGDERLERPERPERPEGFPAPLARALDLSEEQKKQIGSIVDAQRGLHHARKKKERELREELRGIEEAVPLNEAALQAAVQKLSALEVEHLVARAKSRARIEALLTPAQRTLAERLRPRRGDIWPTLPCGRGPGGREEQASSEAPERRWP